MTEPDRTERITRGWQLIESQAYPEAEALFLDLVREVEAQLGDEAPELINLLYGYAGSVSKQHPWNVLPAQAREALERALRIACRADGEDSRRATRIRNTLAKSLACAGEYELAIQHMEIVVRVMEPILGEGVLLAHELNGLAEMYARLGRYAEAVSLYERAFAMAGDRGNDLDDFFMLFARGRALVGLERYADATLILERAYTWCLNKYGERHKGTLELRDWIARAREGQKTELPK